MRFVSTCVDLGPLSSAAMSLAFLSKKGWHTSNLQNVEKVWIAEQKQEKEAKRVLELQKQIEEERQIDDLRALQRNQGLVTDPREKLEWMYEGPSSGAGQDRESVAQAAEYKLGKGVQAERGAVGRQGDGGGLARRPRLAVARQGLVAERHVHAAARGPAAQGERERTPRARFVASRPRGSGRAARRARRAGASP